MTLADRKRLAAILGMLGSEHQGERDAAAFHAEAFRRKHRLTWAELLALPPIEVASEPPAPPEPEPEPDPAWADHVKRFHEAGRAAYPDWDQRCGEVISLGVDAQFAELLILQPDGVRLVAALAKDPKSVKAIATLKTEAERSRALAEFAASLHRPPPPPPPIHPMRAWLAQRGDKWLFIRISMTFMVVASVYAGMAGKTLQHPGAVGALASLLLSIVCMLIEPLKWLRQLVVEPLKRLRQRVTVRMTPYIEDATQTFVSFCIFVTGSLLFLGALVGILAIGGKLSH